MDLELFKEAVLILIDALGFVLTWWVLRKGKDRQLNRLFALMTSSILLWANFAYLGNQSSNLAYALIWYKLNLAAVSLFLPAFFTFIITTLRKNNEAKIFGRIIFVVSILFSLFSIFTDWIIHGVIARSWGIEALFGPLYDIFSYFVVFVVCVVIFYSLKGYKLLSQEIRVRLQYLFIGLSIFIGANLIFNVLFVFLFNSVEYQSFGDFSSIFFLAFTAYAIVKQNLFGTRIVFAGLLVISIAILLLADIFVFTDNVNFQIVKGIVLLVFLYLGRMLVKSIYLEIKRRKELEEKNQSLLALQNLSKIILSTVKLKELIQNVLDSIPGKLGYTVAVLALADKKKGTMSIEGISTSLKYEEAFVSLGKSPVGLEFQLSNTDTQLVKTLHDGVSRTSENIQDFFCPPLEVEYARSLQNVLHCNVFAVFPVRALSQNVKGVIVFGLDKVVSSQDMEMMHTFANYTGIALERVEILERLRMFNVELVNTNEHLKELDKLKDDFVSVASHELRTPMTAIKSYLWMAFTGQGGPLNDKQKYYVDRAYASVERLIKLVNDMLNISRIESGRLTVEMGSVDIVKLVKEVVEEVGPRSKELGVNVSVEVGNDVPMVIADGDKIKEVIYNLVGNSMKFSERGRKIIVLISKKEKQVEVAVKDEGAGIDPEDLPKLFQKFGILPGSYVTNQPTLGTGLGLYICRSLVELHGGKIWAESEGKGKGAIFTFSLKEFNEEELIEINKKNKQSDVKVGLISSKIL